MVLLLSKAHNITALNVINLIVLIMTISLTVTLGRVLWGHVVPVKCPVWWPIERQFELMWWIRVINNPKIQIQRFFFNCQKDKEKQQILRLKKLEPVNVQHCQEAAGHLKVQSALVTSSGAFGDGNQLNSPCFTVPGGSFLTNRSSVIITHSVCF